MLTRNSLVFTFMERESRSSGRKPLLTSKISPPCLFQMHPLGLCNSNDEEDLYEYGWVGVVKLEQPELDPSCLTVLGKVRHTYSNRQRAGGAEMSNRTPVIVVNLRS